MNAKALILAAHGSRQEPAVNLWISQLGDRVGDELGFEEAVATFHQGVPEYANILDVIQSNVAVIVPFMSSEGYYCNRVLPKQLAKNRRCSQLDFTITPPVGVHDKLPDLVSARIRKVMHRFQLGLNETTIAIVGHGTARSPRSRLATERLADSIRSAANASCVLEAFLDEQPSVESLMNRSSRDALVVIPFLIGAGLHAAHDIPLRLGLKTTLTPPTDRLNVQHPSAQDKAGGSDAAAVLDASVSNGFPMIGQKDDTLVICDAPVGTYSGMVALIADLARSACGVATS